MTSSNGARRRVIYARISQDREGAGIAVERQESDCRELGVALGVGIAAGIGHPKPNGVYRDNDLSAYSGKPRPGYRALLDDIRAGRVDGVLVWHTDRLHRSPAELEEYITACELHGVPTQTVTAGIVDLATPAGRLTARTLGNHARYEVEHMAERIRSAKERGRASGAWQGGPHPFGFRPDGLPVKQGGEGRLAQVPEEAAAIKQAYERLLAGGSIRSIARDWNAHGMRTRNGNPWSVTAVRRLLLAARNAGLVDYGPDFLHREVVGKGRWPEIVDHDTWRAARAILTDPKRHSSPGPKPRWLLTGVLICGVCGSTWFRAQKRPHGRDGYTYMCLGGLQPGGTFHLSRRQDTLDAYVEEKIIERLSQRDLADAVKPPSPDVSALDAKLAGLRARLGDLASAYAAGDIDPIAYGVASKTLTEQIRYAEQEISRVLSDSHPGPDPFAEFDGTDPEIVWARLGIGRRRAVAAKLLRVRLLPAVRGRHGFDESAAEIIWERDSGDDEQPAAAVERRNSREVQPAVS
jgi:DNA invertase Pin-like site-specific DNA recombinase